MGEFGAIIESKKASEWKLVTKLRESRGWRITAAGGLGFFFFFLPGSLMNVKCACNLNTIPDRAAFKFTLHKTPGKISY